MDYNLAEYKCVWKNPHNSKIYAAEWYTLSGKQNYQKTTQAVTYSMFNFTINKFNFPVHTQKNARRYRRESAAACVNAYELFYKRKS